MTTWSPRPGRSKRAYAFQGIGFDGAFLGIDDPVMLDPFGLV